MTEDPELTAMNTVYNALKGLEDDGARVRVLGWVSSRFSLKGLPVNPGTQALAQGFDGQTPNGAAPNGAASNGAAPNGAAPNGAAPNGAAPNGAAPNGAAPNGAKKLTDYKTIGECVAAAKPGSPAYRALVVAAYRQEMNGGNDLTGYEINKELTHLGHGVDNITRTLTPLIEADPQLLIQTRKSGNTRQAKKKYRVTEAGFTKVLALLSGLVDEEQPQKES